MLGIKCDSSLDSVMFTVNWKRNIVSIRLSNKTRCWAVQHKREFVVPSSIISSYVVTKRDQNRLLKDCRFREESSLTFNGLQPRPLKARRREFARTESWPFFSSRTAWHKWIMGYRSFADRSRKIHPLRVCYYLHEEIEQGIQQEREMIFARTMK